MIKQENADIILYVAIAIFVGGLIYMLWPWLSQISPIRIRSPFTIRKQGQHFSNQIKKIPSRIEYDNVLWEDGGTRYWGSGVVVIGPLCPNDFTPLCTEDRGQINSNPSEDTLISDSDYNSRLFCLKCKSKYTLGTEPKSIEDSRDEVNNLFEGKRRREQET